MLLLPDRLVDELLTPAVARDAVIAALADHAAGLTVLSEPRSQFLRSGHDKAQFHLKGAALGPASVAGFRIGGFPPAGVDQTGTQLMVLSDLARGAPLALVATDTLTGVRVGAALAVTAEWLRPAGARTLTLVGTGKLARFAARAIQATTPFERVQVVGRMAESAARLCDALETEGIGGVVAAPSLAEACRSADVVVTITSADAPLIQAGWLGPSSLLISAGGGRECEDRAILGADKLFVDDWAQCTILGDIAALHRAGAIDETAVSGTLADVVAGRVSGRDGNERIVAVPQGLTILDVALGHLAYSRATAAGMGTGIDWP